ncbi:lysylphosphatidylglycerol synthase transmembrane domain-containing protein [Fulvimarina sp. MAC8]|uniref:lysylphosphatidylglycerol synthase transmembrane domain-containing protein n=1 Tax=Fulvimarina sp. MAC8 TaxID=3162874 RepID=UPI0032EF61C4
MQFRPLVLLRILVPLALFAGLLAVVDFGKAFDLVTDASQLPLIAALVLVQVQIVLAAIRWRLTAVSLGQPLGLKRAVREYYGASLLNLVLPGGVSGDVVRIARNRHDQNGEGDWERSAHAVILERASGQLAFAAIAAAGLVLWAVNGESAPDEAVIGVKTIALIVVAFVVASIVAAMLMRGRVRKAIQRFWVALRLAFLQPRQAVYQLILSFALVAAYLAVFALASFAVGAPLDLYQVLLFVPPVLLTMIVPISVGGWGVREAAAAALWPLAGYAPSVGIAASVLYGLVSTVGALPGLFAFDFTLPRWLERRTS